MNEEDWRYSDEAQERGYRILWKCDGCGREREDYPGVNEGGPCDCGGFFLEAGETYAG